MSIYSFIRLIRMIFGKELPNLKEIEEMGLLAIKISQHFALRIDFLDERVCIHLSKLFTQSSYKDYKETIEIAESYNGKGFLNNFDNFNYIPFASASIGQVHHARINSLGELVVKILKKEYKEEFIRDIEKIEGFVKFILFFYPKLEKVFDPLGVLEYIREYTMEELDFKNEIRGSKVLCKIKEDEKKYDLEKLAFPQYIKGLSNEKILVSKKIEGETFDKLLRENKLKYEELLELFHIHGYYMFNKGLFHGDIHPGNIIKGLDGKIYFVDNGSISKVEDKLRIGLFNFFKYLSDYDYIRCAHYLNKMAIKEIKGEKYKKFEDKFLDLYKDFTNSTVSQVSLTKKMMETIKLGVNSGMVFEKGMFPIIKSLMYLDGMVLKCNPNAILLKDMKNFIEEFENVIIRNIERT